MIRKNPIVFYRFHLVLTSPSVIVYLQVTIKSDTMDVLITPHGWAEGEHFGQRRSWGDGASLAGF